MNPRILVPTAVLIASMLTACGDKTPAAGPDSASGAPAPTGTANAEPAEENEAETPDGDLQHELDEIAAKPIRLLAENGIPKASIAANGDLSIGGKAVAIDDAQRARLLAYRTQLVAMVQAGVELGSRSTGTVAAKIGDAIDKVFEGEAPGDVRAELKAEGKLLDLVAKRICDALPDLLREQQALSAALPAFEPYAHFVQADVDACRGATVGTRTSGEKIGKTIGAAIGNPFKGGLVAGYMAAEADKAAEEAGKAADEAIVAESSPASPGK